MAKQQYEWRPGPQPKVPADVFATELERIAGDDPIQMVDADAVWQSARKPRSPIHDCFNWNQKEAAESHWRDHARQLIRSLVPVLVNITAGPTISSHTGRFFNVRVDDRRGWISERRIVGDRELTVQVLASTKKELQNFVAKYQTVLGFGNVVSRLQETIDEINDELDRMETEAARRGSGKPTGGKPSGAGATI